MSGYDGEGTGMGGTEFGNGPDLNGFGSAPALGGKPGEDAAAQAMATGSGANQALSNAARQGLGWGDVQGFNLNNPTQSVNEMANSENFSNMMASVVGYSPATDMTSFNGIMSSPFGQIARMLVGLTPMGAFANAGLGLIQNRDDPVKALMGLVPGWGGSLARSAYGAIQAPDPLAAFGNGLLSAGAGMLGGHLAGPVGAKLGSTLAGQFGGPSSTGSFSPASGQQQLAAQGQEAPSGNFDQRWEQLLSSNFGGGSA